MNLDCPREQDVLDAIASGRWPGRCPAEFQQHVRACGICADVAEIAGLLGEERELAWKEADVPAAAVVWWRAQMQARAEAVRLAGRPIAVAQGLAAVAVVGALAGLVRIGFPWLAQAMEAGRNAIAWLTPRAADVSYAFTMVTGLTVPAVAVMCSILLAPILLYLALADE